MTIILAIGLVLGVAVIAVGACHLRANNLARIKRDVRRHPATLDAPAMFLRLRGGV